MSRCTWLLLKFSPQYWPLPETKFWVSWICSEPEGLFLWWNCYTMFFPLTSDIDSWICAKGGNRWMMTGCFYWVTWFFFPNDLMRWDVLCPFWMMHYAWNVPKPSCKGFFKTLFCVILNSSGPSREAVKGQPMFQRSREKVVFSTAFRGLLTRTAKIYAISCPQSDLKKLLQGTVTSFHAPNVFGGWCPHFEYGGAWVRLFEFLPAH